YGFYCRHIRGLRLNNLHLATSEPDQRPAIHCDDVEDLRVEGFEASAPSSGEPLIRLLNVNRALIAGCLAPEKAAIAVTIEGAQTREIRLVANDFSHARKALELRADAPASEVSSSEDRTLRPPLPR